MTWTGLKKCMPAKRVGPVGRRGHLGDREGRGVGGEEGVGRRSGATTARKVSILSAIVLGHRLDHQVRRPRTALGQVVVASCRRCLARRPATSAVDLAQLDALVEVLVDRAPRPSAGRSATGVVETGGVAGEGGDVGDAAAHGAARRARRWSRSRSWRLSVRLKRPGCCGAPVVLLGQVAELVGDGQGVARGGGGELLELGGGARTSRGTPRPTRWWWTSSGWMTSS